MKKNVVIKTLETIIGTDAVAYFSGNINYDKDTCSLSDMDDAGSVYGIAIKINTVADKKTIFNAISDKERQSIDIESWVTIGDDYYPLYWGTDKTCGARIHSHTKSYIKTATVQLDKKCAALKNHEIIFGIMPCINRNKHEKEIQNKYPFLLKTLTLKVDETNKTAQQTAYTLPEEDN